jgi:hypothetical protein
MKLLHLERLRIATEEGGPQYAAGSSTRARTMSMHNDKAPSLLPRKDDQSVPSGSRRMYTGARVHPLCIKPRNV